jgi:uncharacterized protein
MSEEALPPLPAPAALEPVKRQERIAAMDVLRGIAVLGIFLINMPLFVGPSDAFFQWERNVLWTKEADRLASLFIWIFAQGKFYTIFCFLFGAGFALQVQRLDANGIDVVDRLHRRRMCVLLGIGILHFVFVWWGDILHLYALLGFLLPGLIWMEDRKLLLTAALLTLIPMTVSMAWESRPRDATHDAQTASARTTRTLTDIKIMSRGGFSDILKHRLRRDADQVLYETWWALQLLPSFLLGLVAARRRLFTETEKYRRLLLALALAGLPLGLAITAGDLWWGYQNPLGEAPLWRAELGMIREFLGRPAMAFGYVALLLLIGVRAWMAPFAAVGRMALTNYLLQSIVFTTVANSYGLGLYGRVHPLQGLLWCFGFYALQLVVSMLWLRWFAYGPVEWVWRRLTYGRV